MLKRILAVIISSITLALGISLTSYVPEEQREPGVYYAGVSESFIFVVYFLLIFYAVIGIPASWTIDKWRWRYSTDYVRKRYFIGMALYSLAGLVVGAVLYFTEGYIQFFLDILLETAAFGFVASVLYFHILWVLEERFSANTNAEGEKPRNT